MDKLKIGETAVLEDGREYNCFANLKDNGKEYVFLISNFKPLEVKFAEQRVVAGDLQIKIISDQELKIHLLNCFQEKYGQNFMLNNNK